MTSAQDGLAALEYLDWQTVQCQSSEGCTRQATHIVEIHVVDFCDESWVNPFGNTVGILCGPCMDEVESDVRSHVRKLSRFGRPMCLTCGAPVVDVGDILRDRKRL